MEISKKSLFWQSWIPRANFRQKNLNFEFNAKMSLPNSHKHLDVLSTIIFRWLPWRRRHFCFRFSSLLSSIFRKDFQTPILKQKCVDLNCWELNLTAIGWFLGYAIQNRISYQSYASVYGNGLAGVFLFSGTLAIETRNLSYSELRFRKIFSEFRILKFFVKKFVKLKWDLHCLG